MRLGEEGPSEAEHVVKARVSAVVEQQQPHHTQAAPILAQTHLEVAPTRAHVRVSQHEQARQRQKPIETEEQFGVAVVYPRALRETAVAWPVASHVTGVRVYHRRRHSAQGRPLATRPVHAAHSPPYAPAVPAAALAPPSTDRAPPPSALWPPPLLDALGRIERARHIRVAPPRLAAEQQREAEQGDRSQSDAPRLQLREVKGVGGGPGRKRVAVQARRPLPPQNAPPLHGQGTTGEMLGDGQGRAPAVEARPLRVPGGVRAAGRLLHRLQQTPQGPRLLRAPRAPAAAHVEPVDALERPLPLAALLPRLRQRHAHSVALTPDVAWRVTISAPALRPPLEPTPKPTSPPRQLPQQRHLLSPTVSASPLPPLPPPLTPPPPSKEPELVALPPHMLPQGIRRPVLFEYVTPVQASTEQKEDRTKAEDKAVPYPAPDRQIMLFLSWRRLIPLVSLLHYGSLLALLIRLPTLPRL
ncbi:hypothetical protein FIBSPDRAFT_947510 [Athelia psychrophila]|uniref:Uncharacterized protein n=1 Tax=Athelia psychrophila TaxID=1759441 RepID=A0A166RUY8_9AGAM|nr:hypothetical protein FIBSPDRAFT_947510 [Fibularhizoctonia sp. CBS 109695]